MAAIECRDLLDDLGDVVGGDRVKLRDGGPAAEARADVEPYR